MPQYSKGFKRKVTPRPDLIKHLFNYLPTRARKHQKRMANRIPMNKMKIENNYTEKVDKHNIEKKKDKKLQRSGFIDGVKLSNKFSVLDIGEGIR